MKRAGVGKKVKIMKQTGEIFNLEDILCLREAGHYVSFLNKKYLRVGLMPHDIISMSTDKPTLMTSQGPDTVTSIFKCISSNTITSSRLLKMA